jgi:hypothetical protein
MAKNQTRSMVAEMHQGSIDNSYIQLAPGRAAVENPPTERLGWPQYRNAELWPESPFFEASIRHATRPREIKSSGDDDTRF